MSRKPTADQKERIEKNKNIDATRPLVEESKEMPINRHIGKLLKKKFDINLNSENSDDVFSTFQSWTRFS